MKYDNGNSDGVDPDTDGVSEYIVDGDSGASVMLTERMIVKVLLKMMKVMVYPGPWRDSNGESDKNIRT